MGGCQNYGPFLDPYCNMALVFPKRNHNFDNHPCGAFMVSGRACRLEGLGS